MNTLLIRLDGIFQGWGFMSRFGVIPCARRPTKSGVMGLLCAALGMRRHQQVPPEMLAMRFGVREDRSPCSTYEDFQTAEGGFYQADGKVTKRTIILRKFYLIGAKFLAGFESEDAELLSKLHEALAYPFFMLYLGKKCCMCSNPPFLADGLRIGETLEEAFQNYALNLQVRSLKTKAPKRISCWYEVRKRSDADEITQERPNSDFLNKRRFLPSNFRYSHLLVDGGKGIPVTKELVR